MIKVGIFGATGYAGQQLVSILARHPKIQLDFISSNSYKDLDFSKVYPHFAGFFSGKLMSMNEGLDKIKDLDLVFAALPHGTAFEVAKVCGATGTKLIDLGADFRLDSKEVYEQWYGVDHQAEEYIGKVLYGLPEISREDIKKASFIAAPGCYPTASILALAPLGLTNNSTIIIDAKSATSGAGRKGDISLIYTEAGDTLKAYGIASHRHTPEIEQVLSKLSPNKDEDIRLNFTPHLVPMKRGLLSTCYVNLNKTLSKAEAFELYESFYATCPFVRIRRETVETRFVVGTNYCDISLTHDPRTNRMIITSAIDNLIKGASGQAVQDMNLMFGFDETEGLDILWPTAP